jgi:hypothetical protein
MIPKIPYKISKDRFVIEKFYTDDETFRLWTFDSPGIRIGNSPPKEPIDAKSLVVAPGVSDTQ